MKKDSIKLKSNAKLNLFLKINGINEQNYHDMTMINHSVNLYDEIEITKTNSNEINILGFDEKIPKEKNLMYKTAILMKEIEPSISLDIKISKNIPMQAGLGGGSSNAAAIIVGVDKLYDMNLSYDKKIEIAKKIGADVPFCVFGGYKHVAGIGEKLVDIKSDRFFFIIVKPREDMPTKEAFKLFDKIGSKSSNVNFMEDILHYGKKVDINIIKRYFYNDFESAICKKISIIDKIKDDFYKNNAQFSMMSGSGTTVYGIYEDEFEMKNAYNNMKNKYEDVFLAKSEPVGVEFIKEDF